MKHHYIYPVLFTILLLSACAQKAVYHQPFEPDATTMTSGQQATDDKNDNEIIPRAEIAHLINVFLLQKSSRYKNPAFLKKDFVTPAEFRALKNPLLPDDVKNHPLYIDIKNILSYNFRGLTVDDNNRFRPDDPLSRAEFALLLEDILARGLEDDGLPTRYCDSRSPFTDVHDDYFAKNSIITVTTKKLMTVDDNKRFRPANPISRSKAKKAIMKLQELP